MVGDLDAGGPAGVVRDMGIAAQAAERGERGIGREAALGRGVGRAGLGAMNRRIGLGQSAGTRQWRPAKKPASAVVLRDVALSCSLREDWALWRIWVSVVGGPGGRMATGEGGASSALRQQFGAVRDLIS